MMKPLLNLLVWAAAGIVIAIVLFSFMQPPLPSTQNQTPPQIPPASVSPPPDNTPPESLVDLILIDADECTECINGTMLLDEMKSYLDALPNIRVSSSITIERKSADALALIEQYNLEQVPALIVIGSADYPEEFTSTWMQKVGTREPDGAFVSRLIPLPFYSMDEGRVVGLVRGIAIRPSLCPDCIDPTVFFNTLEDKSVGGVYFTDKKILDENSTEAQAIVSNYNITKLPTALVDSEIEYYPVFSQITNFKKTDDGWHIVRDIRPPYVDLSANHTVRGLVEAVLIVNSSCLDCMDINAISDAITFPNGVKAIALTNKTVYQSDSEEARALISKYHLSALPALLYSPEIALYPDFGLYWKQQNSTVEGDGWFVFRAHALTGLPYQNISG